MTQNFLNLEIHTLICKRDLILAINNFKSLQRFEEFKDVPVILHDDGSLSDADIESLSSINNVEVIRRADADKEIVKYIENYPNCLKYRTSSNPINLWHKIKSFDYFYFSKTKRVLGLDTDLLFLQKPENIIEHLKNNVPFYFPDIMSAYCFNEPKDEIPVLPNVNTGLIYIPSEDYYSINAIEHALTNLVGKDVNYFPSWIEQSAFAHMFYKDGRYVSLDIQKYRIPYFQDVDIKKAECLHFVSYPPVRETYKTYLNYLEIGSGELVYEKAIKVAYKDKLIPLEFQIYRNTNFYTFEYYWGLEVTDQKQLDHIFKIHTQEGEVEYKLLSTKNGFFTLTTNSNIIRIEHTYDWFSEMNWEDLGEVVLG